MKTMTLSHLVERLKPGSKVKIKDQIYTVKQHIIWWQARTDQNYDKYVLEDGNGKKEKRLFISGDFIGLSEIFEYEFQEPMPEYLDFEDKKYKLTQDEFCVAKFVEGEEIYKKGDCEIWWDYISLDNNETGLSLGRNWETWEREDLKTSLIHIDDVIIDD